MIRISLLLSLSVILILSSGCSAMIKSDKDLFIFDKVDEIKHQVEQEDWQGAFSNVKAMKKTYQNRKWKMQLLGSRENYNGIAQEIEILKETIKERDKVESKASLMQIKHHLSMIYSF